MPSAITHDAIAFIREAECIGCTKCIQSCPTDAILGASKMMHTIITDACTGCGLCVEPCPVDCIDIVALPTRSTQERERKTAQWNERERARHIRLERMPEEPSVVTSIVERQAEIAAAVLRMKSKKR